MFALIQFDQISVKLHYGYLDPPRWDPRNRKYGFVYWIQFCPQLHLWIPTEVNWSWVCKSHGWICPLLYIKVLHIFSSITGHQKILCGLSLQMCSICWVGQGTPKGLMQEPYPGASSTPTLAYFRTALCWLTMALQLGTATSQRRVTLCSQPSTFQLHWFSWHLSLLYGPFMSNMASWGYNETFAFPYLGVFKTATLTLH